MRHPGKTIGYGLLLIPIWFVSLFVLSIFFKNEQPIDFVSANIITAAVMTLAAWWLARKIHAQTTKEGMTIGALWAVIVLVVLFIVGFDNKTLGNIFGNWTTYLTYVGILVGSFLAHRRTPPPTASSTGH